MINSALGLAQQINRLLKVLWVVSPDLNCSYFSLFQTPDEFEVVDMKYRKPPSMKVLRKISRLYDLTLLRLQYQKVLMQNSVDQLCQQGYDFNRLDSYKSVYIECCNRFYRSKAQLSFVRPTRHIQQTVNTYVQQYQDYTVGVHIRRTDHQIAIQSTPEQFFIDAMNDEIRWHPNVRFFLASDCPDTMSRLTKTFQGHVISHSKDFSRSTHKGVQDALVDLLCLSQTQKIIGSYYSSFSKTAAQIGKIPLHTIKGDNE